MTVLSVLIAVNVLLLLANLTIFFRWTRVIKAAQVPLKVLASRSSTTRVLDNLINSHAEQMKLDSLTYSQVVQLKRVLDESIKRRGILEPKF